MLPGPGPFPGVVTASPSSSARPLGAQRGAPVTTLPQWLNADSSKKTNQSDFRGIEQWPTPKEYRTASGSPGPRYWQQKVAYVINVGRRRRHGWRSAAPHSPVPLALHRSNRRLARLRICGEADSRATILRDGR